MLTVKHISPAGLEAVFPALEVTYNPVHFPLSDNPVAGERGYVWYIDPDTKEFGHRRLDDGTVYVMNDNGATVARYYLKAPLPLAGETQQAA